MLKNLTYSIGHVAEMVDVSQSTLRYWETVIDRLNPVKTAGGSRRYTAQDIELIQKLKVLLHDEGYTIKGVNKYLATHHIPSVSTEEKAGPPSVDKAADGRELLENIRARLQEIKYILENDEE
ncbi:MAG TPA: MerR family transcriptional regulator [Caldithrix abyssi]|uniref:MerR family transcriptional regulator n=1 Tax=Caldithrix abyssi TaxID=187145 RepID=A0A7V1LNC6_CALAY|nr:MerR family transcriptional regulator [Caldithrix abyssi]